jgi:hypothetical protein
MKCTINFTSTQGYVEHTMEITVDSLEIAISEALSWYHSENPFHFPFFTIITPYTTTHYNSETGKQIKL